MDDVVAVVVEAVGKADVGGAVHQHLVAPGADAVQRADHAAQHAVLVADVLCLQPGDAVALCLPLDDGVIILFGGRIVAEGRVLHPGDHFLLHGGHRGKVHVGHPHGDGVKALFGGRGRKAVAQPVHRQCVLAVAVQQRCKIVFHGTNLLSVAQNPHGPRRQSVRVGCKISPR